MASRSAYGRLSPLTAPTALIGKVCKGSRPCENSATFSHGPISFAFSSPETVQRRRNYGNLRSARPVGKFRGVLTRRRPFAALLDRRNERAERARKRTEPERGGCANCGHSHRSIIVVLTTAMSVTAKYFVMYICVANPLDSA